MTRSSSGPRALFACAVLRVYACDDTTAHPPPRPAADSGTPWTPPVVDFPADSKEPFLLSQTGLYRDIATKKLAPDLLEYEPIYTLWSDAAEKSRWLRLPEGSEIDTRDMDHWVFPIGTMLFKEFRREDKRLETRIIARTGSGPNDYFMGAFAWDDAEQDAVLLGAGKTNVRDTDHDIPEPKRCRTCHNGEVGRVLGYSAIQQPLATAPLSEERSPPYLIGADELTRKAVGYLHANCGNCHNQQGTSRTDTNLVLRLSTTEQTIEDSELYKSTVDVELDHWLQKGYELRIAPGEPGRSALLARMKSRVKADAMPPFASKHVDDDGVALIEHWISSLTPL